LRAYIIHSRNDREIVRTALMAVLFLLSLYGFRIWNSRLISFRKPWLIACAG